MSQLSTSKQRLKKLPTECKICEAPAVYSYFSVVVCHSCSIFFRRNAQAKQDRFKCPYEGHCEININTRHTCACCRLAKCFASGMQAHMIRPPHTGKSNKQKKTSITQKKDNQPEQLLVLNLLENDQSILGINEWNLLSNINHNYDETSGCLFIHRYIREQSELPPKMRFKMDSIAELFRIITSASRVLYEKNIDFISLCSHDRSILIHKTMKHVVGLSVCLILRCTRSLACTSLYEFAENIYGSSTLAAGYRAIEQLNLDIILVKLVLTLLTFCTFDSTNMTSNNLLNIKTILCIQDKYTNLTWRYLLYQYGHERAVICFSNFMRCLFSLNNVLIDAIEWKQFTDIIDLLIKQTEETFIVTL